MSIVVESTPQHRLEADLWPPLGVQIRATIIFSYNSFVCNVLWSFVPIAPSRNIHPSTKQSWAIRGIRSDANSVSKLFETQLGASVLARGWPWDTLVLLQSLVLVGIRTEIFADSRPTSDTPLLIQISNSMYVNQHESFAFRADHGGQKSPIVSLSKWLAVHGDKKV